MLSTDDSSSGHPLAIATGAETNSSSQKVPWENRENHIMDLIWFAAQQAAAAAGSLAPAVIIVSLEIVFVFTEYGC